jgi:hypothetical protein
MAVCQIAAPQHSPYGTISSCASPIGTLTAKPFRVFGFDFAAATDFCQITD